jgi:hypothetical protein
VWLWSCRGDARCSLGRAASGLSLPWACRRVFRAAAHVWWFFGGRSGGLLAVSGSNYVFKPTAELLFRIHRTLPPRRLNTALGPDVRPFKNGRVGW